MEVSAKWWGLLSDHVRSIKKSVAAFSQAHEEELRDSEEQLSKILQKPLQPASTLKKNSHTTSNASVRESTLSMDTNQSRSLENSFRKDPPLPLPPRRPPAPPSVPLEPFIENPPPQVITSPVPPLSPVFAESPEAIQSSLSITAQMEMALNHAVEESKPKTVSSNPWGEEEFGGNVWG